MYSHVCFLDFCCSAESESDNVVEELAEVDDIYEKMRNTFVFIAELVQRVRIVE